MKLRLALLVAVLPLAACGGLFQSHAVPTLVYAPAQPLAEPLAPAVPGILVVARPEAAPGLDGDTIAVALPGDRRDVLAGARWSAPVPELVQAQLVGALSASGGWRTVLSDRSAFTGAYLLQTEVRAYTVRYERIGEAPRVEVWLHGELGRMQDRAVLASIDARGASVAAQDRQAAVVAAFDAALGQATATLAREAHAACAAVESRPARP